MAPSLPMRAVRAIRTFDVRGFIHEHPTRIYWGLFGAFCVGANIAQYRRMRHIYPNYDRYASLQGGQYNEAKSQELADVRRYNNMVDGMRKDLNARNTRNAPAASASSTSAPAASSS